MDRPSSLFTSYSGHLSRQTESPPAPLVGTTSVQLLYIFLVFQLVNQIFLPILIATFLFSKSVKRQPTVVNACMTWVITGIISSLLWYAGKQVGPEPPTMLCVSQASLLQGVVPMNSVSVLNLMFQVNLNIRNPKAMPSGIRTYALLVTPYITFFGFSTSAAFLAVQRPETVTRARRFFYCSFHSPISNVFAIFSALALIIALGYAVGLGVFFRNNWRNLQHTGNTDLQFLARVAGFVLYVFLALILSLLSIVAPRSPFPDLFIASSGTALFIFLSTQRDVWRTWLRRPKPVAPPVMEYRMPSGMPDLDFDFKDRECSNAYGPDVQGLEANLEGPDAHELDVKSLEAYLEDPKTHVHARELNLKDRGLRIYVLNGDAEAVMHNNASMIPKDGSRYQRPPWDGNTNTNDSSSSSRASRDHDALAQPGDSEGVDVTSSYRFARPGMI